MIIKKLNIQGNAGVGAFLMASDKYALIPRGLSVVMRQHIEEAFNVKMIECTIGGSRLMGVYTVGNSNGCAVPFFTEEDEIQLLQNAINLPIVRVSGSLTALGNTIVANDHGAIAHPGFDKNALKSIEQALGVSVVQGTIADSPLVGSLGVSTSVGTLVHPKISDAQISLLEKELSVPVDIGTVMRGSPYISLGLTANKNGSVTSRLTTGPELARISQTFGFVL